MDVPDGGTERGNVLVAVRPEGKLLRVTVGVAEALDSWAVMSTTMLLLGISTKELGVTLSESVAGFGVGPGPLDEPPPQEIMVRQTATNTNSR